MRIIIFIVFHSFIINSNLFSQEHELDKLTEKDSLEIKKLDSIFFEKNKEINSKFDSLINTLTVKNNALIEKENTFWKDRAFWYITVIGGLLALVPIFIGFIEYFKNDLIQSFKDIKHDIEDLRKKSKSFDKDQIFLDLYFSHVLKPIIQEIIGDLPCEEKVKVKLVTLFTDYEKVVELFHFEDERTEAARIYLSKKGTKYAKVKLETLKRKTADPKKLKIIDQIMQELNDNLYNNKI